MSNKNGTKPIGDSCLVTPIGWDWNRYIGSWLLDYLAKNNSKVMVALNDDGSFVTCHDEFGHTVTIIFNPEKKYYQKISERAFKEITFWELIKGSVSIRLAGSDVFIHKDAIIDMYRKYFKKYVI
jgi:hypothetical protein